MIVHDVRFIRTLGSRAPEAGQVIEFTTGMYRKLPSIAGQVLEEIDGFALR